MSKNAALESVLGSVHQLVATVMASQLTQQDKVPVLDAQGNIMLDKQGNPVMSTEFTASPQLLSAAIKFLKDNEVTCTREQSTEVNKLAAEVDTIKQANQDRLARIKEQRKMAIQMVKAK